MSVTKRTSLIVLIVSACALAHEVLLFQTLRYLSQYMMATLVIAVSLLGLGVGGMIAALLPDDRHDRWFVRCLVVFPASIILSFFTPVLLVRALPVAIPLVAIPYVAAGIILSVAFTKSDHPNRIYYMEMVGAAIGVVLVTHGLPLFREEGMVFVLSGLAGLAPLLASPSPSPASRVWRSLATCLLGGVIVLSVSSNTFNLALITPENPNDYYKIFSLRASDRRRGYTFDLRYSKSSLVERIDIKQNIYQANALDTIYNGYLNDHVNDKPPLAYKDDVRIPDIHPDPRVLVIGLAAQGVAKTAKCRSSYRVVGVELNPAIVSLMNNELFEASARAYEGIEVHVTDGRTFLSTDRRLFDVITLMNTHRTRGAHHVGGPEYLHTVEAFTDMFQRLTDDGFIVIEERNNHERGEITIHRIILTLISVLRERYGVPDPDRHLVVFDSGRSRVPRRKGMYTVILAKRTPFSPSELSALDKYDPFRRLDRAREREHYFYRPDMAKFDAPWNVGNGYATVVAQGSGHATYAEDYYDLAPITDDRPFPSSVFRKKKCVDRIMGTSACALVPVMIGLLVAVLHASVGSLRRQAAALSHAVYFGALGLGYILIEIYLLQKLQLFLGAPGYAFCVVLATLLFFSGIGGLCSAALSHRQCCIGMIVLVVALLTAWTWSDRMLRSWQSFDFAARVALAVACMAPLGLLMGIPFPAGLRACRNLFQRRAIAAMYGINGACAAVATPLCVYLSLYHGLSRAFAVGILFYVVAALLPSLRLVRVGSS